MDILTLIPGLFGKLASFILIFTRISALFSTFILFRRDIVNARTLLSLSLILSFYVVMLVDTDNKSYDVFSLQSISQLLFQTLIGFIAGLVLNIVFDVFVGFGQIISTQVGLGMASVLDPKMGHITSLTQFYIFSVMLIFFMLNGHLFIIKLLLDSFSVIPLNAAYIPHHIILGTLKYSSIIFNGSILMSITIVIAILLTNFALSVMSKFAPQFNLFSIGINLSLIIGLIYVYLMFDLFSEEAGYYIQGCLVFLQKLLLGPA